MVWMSSFSPQSFNFTNLDFYLWNVFEGNIDSERIHSMTFLRNQIQACVTSPYYNLEEGQTSFG